MGNLVVEWVLTPPVRMAIHTPTMNVATTNVATTTMVTETITISDRSTTS